MSNYNLLVPSVRTFLTHIGALPTAAGFVIGCCDLASMCASQFAPPSCSSPFLWICITWPISCLPKEYSILSLWLVIYWGRGPIVWANNRCCTG